MERRAYEEMASVEATHWWFVARRRILADTIARLDLPAGARILEVGSGTGGNLAMLSDFGAVSAIEMDADARRHAERTTGMTVTAGHVPDDIPFADGSFDLICLFDVLEHIEDDVGALVRVQNLLAPGGRLLITVPAYQWMWSAHDELHHHRRRYARRSLARVLRSSKLRIVRLSYFNTVLFPLAVMVRLGSRLAARRGSPGTAVPSAPVNAALRSLFGAERVLLRWISPPFGLSVMAICRPDGSHVGHRNGQMPAS